MAAEGAVIVAPDLGALKLAEHYALSAADAPGRHRASSRASAIPGGLPAENHTLQWWGVRQAPVAGRLALPRQASAVLW